MAVGFGFDPTYFLHEDIMNVVRTQDLIGPALDWAVAKCEGFSPFTDGISWIVNDRDKYRPLPAYSTDWAQGGPIIKREGMHVDCLRKADHYRTAVWEAWPYASTKYIQQADSPLIAAMRCLVASKLGDTVEVPENIENLA